RWPADRRCRRYRPAGGGPLPGFVTPLYAPPCRAVRRQAEIGITKGRGARFPRRRWGQRGGGGAGVVRAGLARQVEPLVGEVREDDGPAPLAGRPRAWFPGADRQIGPAPLLVHPGPGAPPR